MALRLSLIAQGATTATRLPAFPRGEPLEPAALEQARAMADGLGPVDQAWTSPCPAALETALALGLQAARTDPALRDMDYGDWAGLRLADIPEAELARWIQGSAPPGGESIAALRQRSELWLEQRAGETGRVVAVTHAAWIRAALISILGAGPDAFRQIDIAPLSVCRLSHNAGRWVVQSVNCSRYG